MTKAAAAGQGPVWRAMTPADLADVMTIAAKVHQAYPEEEAVFAERLLLSPSGCLCLGDGGALTGLVNNAAGNFVSRTEDLSMRGFEAPGRSQRTTRRSSSMWMESCSRRASA